MQYYSKVFIIILILLLKLTLTGEEKKYPFIYIPGVFDNGELLTSDSLLVKNLNNIDGFYYKKYFNKQFTYNKEPFDCSSNIINGKYQRLVVANFIGLYRTDISLWLMSDRLFCLMYGRAPKSKNYNSIINYKGNDYLGSCIRDNKTIYFKGIIEEVWAKYGKKVYYKAINNKKRVTFFPDNSNYYENIEGYFDSPEQIKFNFIVHSSGGIAIRRYIQICMNEDLPIHINLIVNLSVPQKGARMMYRLKKGFPIMISDTMDKFFKKVDTGFVEVKNEKDQTIKISYKDLVEKTRISMLYGNSMISKGMRKIIGDYIIYQIKFDGIKTVLGRDPAFRDLHPDHKLIKTLNNVIIPEDILIYNFRVKRAYSDFFCNIGKYLNLGENDGVVDYLDTGLDQIPGSNKLKIKDIVVERANHIPFPYIKPLFEMRETIKESYGFLRILLKVNLPEEEGITLIHAVMKAIMQEMELDLEKLLKNENYSVIDYFADNPVEF